jgi:hypothetical protein
MQLPRCTGREVCLFGGHAFLCVREAAIRALSCEGFPNDNDQLHLRWASRFLLSFVQVEAFLFMHDPAFCNAFPASPAAFWRMRLSRHPCKLERRVHWPCTMFAGNFISKQSRVYSRLHCPLQMRQVLTPSSTSRTTRDLKRKLLSRLTRRPLRLISIAVAAAEDGGAT